MLYIILNSLVIIVRIIEFLSNCLEPYFHNVLEFYKHFLAAKKTSSRNLHAKVCMQNSIWAQQLP